MRKQEDFLYIGVFCGVEMAVISVQDLRKSFSIRESAKGFVASIRSLLSPKYKETVAVESLSLSIEKGELVGFIGPNGAGKSTTLKMLTGIMYPTSGNATVLGITPWRDRKKLAFRIGTVFGQRSQLWTHLPCQDTFDLFAAIYNIPEKTYRTRLRDLVKQFDIEEYLNVPVRKLSLGERMRAELVAALLHDPEVLFLDEPSIGLDIIAKHKLREHIRAINKRGVTIVLTSHDMADIEAVCSRVIVINHGRLLFDASIEQLRKRFARKKVVRVFFDGEQTFKSMRGVTVLDRSAQQVRLAVDSKLVDIQHVLAQLTKLYRIADIEVSDPPIEEIIEVLYKK